MAKADLTAQRLRELLDYDPQTGLLTWRESRRRARAGEVCTYAPKGGYINIKVEQRKYQAHRLVWLHVHGEFPALGLDIDHINNIKTDNRLVNLRLATRQENKWNTLRSAGNSSGFKGVSWHKSNNAWRASICMGGKTKQLGLFKSAEEAHRAYVQAAIAIRGDFANPG